MAAVQELVRDDDGDENPPNANNNHNNNRPPPPPPRRRRRRRIRPSSLWRRMVGTLIRDRNVSALFLLLQKGTITAAQDHDDDDAVIPLCEEFGQKIILLEMAKKKR